MATDEIVYFDNRQGGNAGLGPPFGTPTLSDVVALDANRECRLSYQFTMVLDQAPPPGTVGSANGSVHFEINPVPDPASLSIPTRAILLNEHRCSRRL